MLVSRSPGSRYTVSGTSWNDGDTFTVMTVYGTNPANIEMWFDALQIYIAGQVQRSQMSKNTGCRQIGDQEFDIIPVVKTMTKYAKSIINPNEILQELEYAYQIAIHGRKGPVWLDIPLDIQAMEIDENQLIKEKIEFKNPIIETSSILKFEKLLEQAKKPLIIIGNGIRNSNCVDKLKNFLLYKFFIHYYF